MTFDHPVNEALVRLAHNPDFKLFVEYLAQQAQSTVSQALRPEEYREHKSGQAYALNALVEAIKKAPDMAQRRQTGELR